MLHVYGKDKVFLPSRLVGFAQMHNVSFISVSHCRCQVANRLLQATVSQLAEIGEREDMVWFRSEWEEFLPDPYEPTYTRAAYKQSSKVKHQYGHLIWGDVRWRTIRRHFKFPKATEDDPLTVTFRDLGKLERLRVDSFSCSIVVNRL